MSAPDLRSYDRIIIAFSGGKDSLASVLHVLDQGVEPHRIELHHHDVDGGAQAFMDWQSTPAYCRKVAQALGLRILFSSKLGGFEREMMRQDTRTAPVVWERPDGTQAQSGGTKGHGGTRLKFPQVSADLSVRWCSAYLKIDVLTAQLRNDPRFQNSSTLVVTGERGEESAARSRYQSFEADRADNRDGASGRLVDHWRPVLGWLETDVWALIQRHRIVPHPAYQLGWSRLSCMTCIFGSPDQWATIRALFPSRFATIADREASLGVTIQRKATITQLADRGTVYPAALAQPELAATADSVDWDGPVTTDSWQLPAGAYGSSHGPT